MDYRNLSSMQLDALREVFNIGSGNAATSLSFLLNRKIDMGIPNIKIVRLEEILENDLNNEVIAVLVKVIGEAPGNILYAFDKHVAKEIIEALISNSDVFSDIGMIASVPAVTHDMFNAILTSTFIESGQYDDYILDIETLFKGHNGQDVLGHFYYIPQPGSLENILKQLGMV